METKEKIRLQRADYPEQIGVSSKEVEALIKDFKDTGIEVHSFMILRGGKVAYETWAEPYAPETPHMMYSVSKSFTSAAIGFAVDEGLITTDTKLIDIFPEYRPKRTDKYLEELTVHHLLCMQSGKQVSVFTDKGKNHWIKDFFDAQWEYEPGKGWSYISENQYMLCALLTRVTGMSVIEYLTPRLFEPLGIDVPFWEHDIDGIEAGGWGLLLKTEDLAKFITCYQQDGVFNGKQVIPKEWVALSRKAQSDNSLVNNYPDGSSGYGYCFWRCAGIHGYRADGMFSQFGIVDLDSDASFILTAGEIDEQKSRDCIWRHFKKCLIEPDSEPRPEKIPQLAPLDDDLPASEHMPLEKEIAGRRIKFRKNAVLSGAGFPTSILTIPVVYMSGERGGNITNVIFEFEDDVCTFEWDEGSEHNKIVCGMDGKPRRSPLSLAGFPFTAVSTAAWTAENKLTLHIRPAEAISMRIITFTFDGDNVTFDPSSQMPMRAMADHFMDDIGFFFQSTLMQRFGLVAFDQLPSIVDATYYGKFVD
ncbi:MAG: serine hydrolase [Clostridia bacterium]|nr:serine hydrolase [Clostridia bacterium]